MIAYLSILNQKMLLQLAETPVPSYANEALKNPEIEALLFKYALKYNNLIQTSEKAYFTYVSNTRILLSEMYENSAALFLIFRGTCTRYNR